MSFHGIQSFCEAFLTAYDNALRCVYSQEQENWLYPEDLKLLADTAVAVYMERTLETDPNLQRSLRSFSAWGYRFDRDGELPAEEEGYDLRNLYQPLWRAYSEKYCALFNLRVEQEWQDNTAPSELPEKLGTARMLDIITLTWCDVWSQGHLDVLDVLVFRKQLPHRKSKRDARQNGRMESALKEYRKYLEKLEEDYAASREDPVRAIKYVAGCILLQKIERSFHIHFAADMANFRLENDLELNTICPSVAAAYWGRFEELGGVLFASAQGLSNPKRLKQVIAKYNYDYENPVEISEISKIRREYNSISDPLVVLNNNKVLRAMYQTSEENVEDEIDREIVRRRAMMDLLTLLYAVFPVEHRRSWTVDDFREAAEFLHSDYPIVKAFLDTEMPEIPKQKEEAEKAHQFYDLFYEFYTNLYHMNDSPLYNAVEALTSQKN